MPSLRSRQPASISAISFITLAFLIGCNQSENSQTPTNDPARASISTQGGTVKIEGVGEALFPPGAFQTPQTVTIKKESLNTLPETLDDARSIYDIKDIATYQVVISMESDLPASDSFQLNVNIPDDLFAKLGPELGIRAMALVSQGHEEESLDTYEVLPAILDKATKKLSIKFNKAWLTQVHNSSGQYEAVVTLATIPGVMPTSYGSLAMQATSACKGKALGSPLDGTPTLSGNPPRGFNPDPQNHPLGGAKKSHWGSDLVAPQGSTVKAAEEGKIERVKFKGDPSTWPVYPNGGGGGQYIVLRHIDGSATAYYHLSDVSVAEGASVKKGDPIGLSGGAKGTPGAGGSTGPHLHFEYSPTGKIYSKDATDKVDPFDCITTSDAKGSIVISDNGSANDDVFQVSLDGIVLGQTPKGGSDSFGLNNLIPGTKTLAVSCLDDGANGNDVCTLAISLGDGLTFEGGGTSISSLLELGETSTYRVIVPKP